jgi:hypothetical protein
VDGPYELEGLAVADTGSTLMVADPDDRSKAAPLLEAAGVGWT